MARVKGIVAISLWLVAATAAAQSPLDRVIDQTVNIHVPLMPCALPSVASAVIQSALIPAGFESVPGECGATSDRVRRDDLRPVTLTGMTVREALDALVRLDPRYVWAESDGVVVVRPFEAAQDRNHFLHRIAASFTVHDVNMSSAFIALQNALGPNAIRDPGFAARSPDGARKFSVDLGATSAIETLNAIVRTHGAMTWRVSYCKPPALYENARIELRTFDGSGFGGGPMFVRGDDGKMHNPCSRK